ncbi:MAG: glutaredoxin family protein [Gammaproteobacteria bacterium]|nr:glutaredoxin family protein [Gammaproteobacteria bacterium]
MRPRLTLLSRSYCHLCADMLRALKALQVTHDFDIEVIDIDAAGHAALHSHYDELVPVLLDGQTEICHYHLDPGAVIGHLGVKGSGSAAKTLESARDRETP